MNTISYKDLKQWHVNSDEAKATAKRVFGDTQPSITQTGFYSAPSWNWGYQIGIVGVQYAEKLRFYEVVTQFGSVVSARPVYMNIIDKTTEEE